MKTKPAAADAALGTTGIALGLIVGLSASPVVATVASGLIGVAAGALGISQQDGGGNPSETAVSSYRHVKVRAVGIAALCLGFIVTAPIALWLRTHDTFSPSLADEAREIQEVQAAYGTMPTRVVVFHRYGLDTEAEQGQPQKASTEADTKSESTATVPTDRSLLFANDQSQLDRQCLVLRPRNDESVADRVAAFQSNKGVWPKIAAKAPSGPARGAFLSGAWEALCDRG
jgi:hypothetical protein